MRLASGAAILFLAGCGALVPSDGPETARGIPITVVNEDDESAVIEVTRYNPSTGREEVALEAFDLAPGQTTQIAFESTRGGDTAFHLKVNGLVSVSSDFGGCAPTDILRPVPESMTITVMPNGEPRACPLRP